ncbi:hypothetical protein [Oceanihabitans sediminis]|uniref:hypothetical protein n=1 Tax=Oceanihabitans sediminis TaxID=1812012 RepID=UPI00299DFBB6|nr:hypothetical protein [Oceanihabitans sediminis]MDX1278555.1 hypothetical protein [Oceanihabitans sediminis]
MRFTKIFLILIFMAPLVFASPNDPTEFGNLTVTTAWLGGATGILNITGNAYIPTGVLTITGNNHNSANAINLKASWANETGKPTILWTLADGTQVGYWTCHNKSYDGLSSHEHCALETLDGTGSVNSHFTVGWSLTEERVPVKFPGSDVQFISGQYLYFGDTLLQGSIVHNGTTGDLELHSNADIFIGGNAIDLNGGDINKVDDIFSSSSASIDLKPDTTVRIFPQGQTSRALQFSDDGSGASIAATGTTTLDILENVNIPSGSGYQINGVDVLSYEGDLTMQASSAGINISPSSGNNVTIGSGCIVFSNGASWGPTGC